MGDRHPLWFTVRATWHGSSEGIDFVSWQLDVNYVISQTPCPKFSILSYNGDLSDLLLQFSRNMPEGDGIQASSGTLSFSS